MSSLISSVRTCGSWASLATAGMASFTASRCRSRSSARYEIVVRTPAGEVLRPGPVMLRKESIEPQDDLPPILLTSTGRSGTSLMMRRLERDKSIVVSGHFPYETKLLTYYAHAFEILTAPGNHERSVNPDLIFDDPYHLGLNPFNHENFADTFPRPSMIAPILREILVPYRRVRVQADRVEVL